MIPAVVLTGNVIGLAAVRALGIMGVPVTVIYYEEQDISGFSRYVREKVRAPHPARHEDEYIDVLIEHSKKNGKGILFPADDAALKATARNKALLQDYYQVACPEWDITEKFIDKKYTYSIADHVGVPCPRTLVPDSEEEAIEFGGLIDYPCLIKPCESHLYFAVFRKKMVLVENIDELVAEYRKSMNAGLKVMLQEYIPGGDDQGVNYNSFFIGGEALLEFTAQKVRLSPPSFGVPRVVVSREIPEVIEDGRKILKAMGFYGYSCTEFKKDSRDGRYKLMEVNGRHNRSGLLALHCGINFPWVEYRFHAYGERPEASGFRSGVYWIDEASDILNSIKRYKDERYGFWKYLEPYRAPHVFAVFDLKDFKPFGKRVIEIGKLALQGGLHKLKT